MSVSVQLSSRNSSGQTPLHKAAISDNIPVATFLLDMGSDINAMDNEMRSPLLLAATRNNINMVTFLITQKCDITLRDMRMRNFLHLLINNQSNLITNNVKLREELNLEKVMDELKKVSQSQYTSLLFPNLSVVRLLTEITDLTTSSPKWTSNFVS